MVECRATPLAAPSVPYRAIELSVDSAAWPGASPVPVPHSGLPGSWCVGLDTSPEDFLLIVLGVLGLRVTGRGPPDGQGMIEEARCCLPTLGNLGLLAKKQRNARISPSPRYAAS